MNPRMLLLGLVVLALTMSAAPDDKPQRIDWSATSTTGAKIKVPGTGPSVLVFVRPDQPQSRTAIEQIKSAVAQFKDVQVIVLVSADQAAAGGMKDLAAGDWPMVIDPDFAASGTFNVHVWPTTVVVTATGEQAAHMAGISDAFATDLQSYLEFASGRIDAAALKRRLAQHEVVEDDATQKANRLLLLATRLLETGQIDQADTELEKAMKLAPGDPKLLVLGARVRILQKKPRDAIALLDQVPSGAVPAWKLNQLRGRALIDLDRWDDARAALSDAAALNPHPAEAHYLRGLILQHDGKFTEAAAEFREAYESLARNEKQP